MKENAVWVIFGKQLQLWVLLERFYMHQLKMSSNEKKKMLKKNEENRQNAFLMME